MTFVLSRWIWCNRINSKSYLFSYLDCGSRTALRSRSKKYIGQVLWSFYSFVHDFEIDYSQIRILKFVTCLWRLVLFSSMHCSKCCWIYVWYYHAFSSLAIKRWSLVMAKYILRNRMNFEWNIFLYSWLCIQNHFEIRPKRKYCSSGDWLISMYLYLLFLRDFADKDLDLRFLITWFKTSSNSIHWLHLYIFLLQFKSCWLRRLLTLPWVFWVFCCRIG